MTADEVTGDTFAVDWDSGIDSIYDGGRMTKHDHHKCCEHENLAYCKVCDVAYCEGCGQEWGTRILPQWSWTTTNIPFDSGDTIPVSSDAVLNVAHDHCLAVYT